MTDMELFELLDGAGIEFTTRPDYCIYELSLSDLAAFIDEYFLPRPRYEDETPVKVGDEFALRGGVCNEVSVFYVYDDGSFAINNFRYDTDQRVKKPEQPDSWEQLEYDIDKTDCVYFGMGKAKSCEGCKAFEHSELTCAEKKSKDIIRRAKELAKGDSE